MIISTIRKPTEKEKLTQIKKLPGAYKRFEDFTMMLIFIIGILLTPLLIYNHFNPVASSSQAWISIIVIAIAVFLCSRLTKKYGGGFNNKRQIKNINSEQVESVKVKTQRAVKREDPEDFGVAYYIDVNDNGKRKTLYLCGQYLDELEYQNLFPNTEFEFVRKVDSEEFIEFNTAGMYFEPERILPPFDKEVWKKGDSPLNGQLFDYTLDSVS